MTNVGFGRKCLIFPPEGYLSVKGDSSNQNTALFIYLFIDFVFWSIALFYPGFDFSYFYFLHVLAASWRRWRGGGARRLFIHFAQRNK